MKIAFRTDASLKIGTGHVMRCLTLANALQATGAQCHFICCEHPGNLIAQIRQRGFAVSVLLAATKAHITDEQAVEQHSNYAAWLGAGWATDAAQTKVGFGATAVDWLIVDHYALDARWEQALRPLYRKLMVIDDLADWPHDCDLLLDQNLGRDAGDYSKLLT
jgi:UDP-2,4-diacetamido-2,4,6-trideoxy-beta-L-altropyranose hydrolase